jgi:hypothetical protein
VVCKTNRIFLYTVYDAQEFGGILIRKDGLVVMAVAEYVEWFSIHSVPAIMSCPPLTSLH